MALCQCWPTRYYQGKRAKVLKQKLPMALIHECCGIVVRDETGTYQVGDKAIMIPNQPPQGFDHSGEFYRNYVEVLISIQWLWWLHAEFVHLPLDRVVGYQSIPDVSSGYDRRCLGGGTGSSFWFNCTIKRDHDVVWGSGSLAFVQATVLRPSSQMLPLL